MSQYFRVFCGTNKSSTKHPLFPGVVCANWRHVRASADDHWWFWILVPLWYDGPHIQGELYFLCHHLVHLFDFFRIICPRKSARIWFCRLLPRLIYHTYYGLKPIEFPYAEISWLILHLSLCRQSEEMAALEDVAGWQLSPR